MLYASFMFMGPTGVGMIELGKALAAYLFNMENALVRIDMSKYMDKHSVSRLVGASPSYVGYEEGGQLTEVVRRRPYSVVLFDEIEKAHHDVFNILLQLLDDGSITDSQGRTVSFTNCIVIMTSKIGSHYILDTLRNTHDSKEAVYEIRLNWLKERLKQKKIDLRFTQEAVDLLGTLGFDPDNGAWPVKRVIQEKVENGLARGMIRGDFGEDDSVVVDVITSSTGNHSSPQKTLVIKKLDDIPTVIGDCF